MFETVRSPVLHLADTAESVMGERSGPHHIGARRIVIGIKSQCQRLVHDIPENGLRICVDKLGIGSIGEISLIDMRHHVDHAESSLVERGDMVGSGFIMANAGRSIPGYLTEIF